MVNWTEEQRQILDGFQGQTKDHAWEEMPDSLKRYKCHSCHHIVMEDPCPNCGAAGKEFLEKMCPLDHCHCPHEIIESIDYCPLCGAPVCPECGSHDVVQLSRVTGYLQEVGGWNAGKQQELKDRTRYNVVTGTIEGNRA